MYIQCMLEHTHIYIFIYLLTNELELTQQRCNSKLMLTVAFAVILNYADNIANNNENHAQFHNTNNNTNNSFDFN